MGDFNASMRGELCRNRRHERRFSHGGDTGSPGRDCDESRHEDGPILIRAAQPGTIRVMALVLVPAPMRVDQITVVVGCGAVVRVCVYKRRAQGRDLDGQRERYREGFPHH